MPNRNVESHFAFNPTNLDMSRSRFDMSFGNKTSFNVGDIIPLCRPIEVLPGDTFVVDTSKVVRLQTLLKPVMDNLYLDTYWFFVPNRLVWEHWKQFMGENTQSAWLPSTEYSIPIINSGSAGWPIGSVADHMGLPVSVANMAPISALPFRGYALICNEWFRSENLSDPLVVPTGDAAVTYDATHNVFLQPSEGGQPYKAAKYFDYFTAALPAPQKGPDVNIPLGTSTPLNHGWIPVNTFEAEHVSSDQYDATRGIRGYLGNSGSNPKHAFLSGTGTNLATAQFGNGATFMPSNLWANVGAIEASINSLRLAFQIQKLYEKDARGGRNLCLHVKKIAEKNWKAA